LCLLLEFLAKWASASAVALLAANQVFRRIVRRCRELQETRIFRREFLRVFEGYAQELQAEINFELLETLHELESYDWYRYGKVRQRREKELRDPDDVFIEAERRRQELARQGKKPPHVYPKALPGKQGKTGKR
jgi:hypothetical protein